MSKALVVNFSGRGNGFMTLPLLACLSSTRFFHTDNTIIDDEWFRAQARVSDYLGPVSATWRRFGERDWEDIEHFLRTERISRIINLRNEGPRYDRGYYAFKRAHVEFEYWDMDFEAMEQRSLPRNLVQDLRSLFEVMGADMSRYQRRWLQIDPPYRQESKVVGMFLGASQRNKRWPVHKWIELVQECLHRTDLRINLFSGISYEERQESREVAREFDSDRLLYFDGSPFRLLAGQMSRCGLLVTPDTSALHLAEALGLPHVGLFTSTDPTVWSYDSVASVDLRSKTLFRCPNWKPIPGNCAHFYSRCPVLAKEEDSITPGRVLASVMRLIKRGFAK